MFNIAQLTDKQRKIIVADYAITQNASEVARMHNVSAATVRRTVKANPDSKKLAEKVQQKNTQDMIEYLEANKEVAQNTLDILFKQLANAEKIEKASLKDVAITAGVVIDKFTEYTSSKGATNTLVGQNLQSLKEVISNPVQVRKPQDNE